MKVLVHYKGKNIYSSEGLRFIPGMNEVQLEDWQRAQRNKLFLKRIENGTLKVQRMPAGYDQAGHPIKAQPDQEQAQAESVESVDQNYSLSGMNAQKAGETIAQTVNVDLLKSWNQQEARKGVTKLILDRIAELETLSAPQRDEDLEDDEDAGDDE